MDPAMSIEVSAMSAERSLEAATARGDSELQQFYRAATLFLTGGSGFMGKQLVEKLLRSCKITKIFVLLRPKGKHTRERLEDMFKDPVFDKLRQQQPDFEQKVVVVEGDASQIRLGLSQEDWKTITEEVDVIIHMAATTRFDEALKVATLTNVRGTREALLLGKSCKKLKSFVHVSTAFAHARSSLAHRQVFEELYPSPIPAESLIAMAETMDVERFHGMTAAMIQDWPNTYTFAKTVAEELIRTMSDGLPICIVRPGIVIAAYREPLPGWLDMSCAYGASGLILGTGTGVIHVIQSNKHANFALVPCDFVNNAIIAAGKEASSSSGGDSTKIYAISSSARNAITQGEFSSTLSKYGRRVPTPKAIFYIFAYETASKHMFLLMTWLLHYIPAFFVDFTCLLLGKERRFFKIYRKVNKISNALTYFTLNGWIFDDKNLQKLYENMSKTDKTIFNFDVTGINWKEYILIWCIGLRKYIVKDGLKDTKYARQKQIFFRILFYILCIVYLYTFWCILRTIFYLF